MSSYITRLPTSMQMSAVGCVLELAVCVSLHINSLLVILLLLLLLILHK